MTNQAIDDISKYAAPHRDRWHYLDFSGGKHKGTYTEWKYFNFIQGDMAGYIMYYVLDPEHKTSLGAGRLVARIMRGGAFHGGIEKVPMDEVEFDSHTASASFGRARLNEKTPHNYEITGNVAGVSWDLEYNQSTPSIDGFSNTSFGVIAWDKVSWLIKMPRARVTGKISINNVPITISATGYSDTNWGEMVPLISQYEWGQFNDANISLVFGFIKKWGSIWYSYVYAEINHEIIVFEGKTVKITEREWGREEFTHIKIPIKTTFEMKSGPYTLKCTFAPARNDIITVHFSHFLPKPCVAEQMSRFTGTLRKNGQTIHSFSGLGFSEYNTSTWKNTAVTF